MIRKIFTLLFMSCLIHVLCAQPPGSKWFCPFPLAGQQKKVKISGMQKYYALPGRYGKEKFILWPARGSSLMHVQYLDPGMIKNSKFYH